MAGRLPELMLNPPRCISWTLNGGKTGWSGCVTEWGSGILVLDQTMFRDPDLDVLLGLMCDQIRVIVTSREIASTVIDDVWTGLVGGQHD